MAAPDRLPISLEELVEETATVYSLPFFYDKLNEAINHPRSSISDIARIITEDQGLTARLLKLANSPMFGYYARVDSITKAVTIIGTQQLRDLALAASVMGIFNDIPEELVSMPVFWQHSIACGIIARCLATFRREINVERYFVAGILHDVGRLVMCTAIPDAIGGIIRASRAEEVLVYEKEQEILGFTHAAVGGELLRKWKIPANVAEPVACHHTPRSAGQYPLETAIVHVADIVCHAMEFGSSGDLFVPPLDEAAWQKIDLPVNMMATILKQAEPQLAETFAILTEGL